MSNASTTIYSLEQFQEAYQLAEADARRIIGTAGNARPDLDAFMLVYRDRRRAESWLMDVSRQSAR